MNTAIPFETKNIFSRFNSLFGWFGLIVISFASLTICLNNVEQFIQGHYYFSSFCFASIFLIALISPGKYTSTIFIFLIPLLPTLNVQIAVFSGITFHSLPMAGSDLVVGYFLGLLLRHLIYSFSLQNSGPLRAFLAPWPINIALFMMTFSVVLAICRNTWTSISLISLNGVVLNLFDFRAIGWFDDFRPMTDFMAYVMAAGAFILTLNYLKPSKNRLALVFRPLLAGLFVSGILAIIQSKTGMGFEAPPTYRDIFGYAPYGFQPDLHAYAGYTLLGVVGLWGYYPTIKIRSERFLILLVILLSWYGLIASISKASIFFAFLVSITCFFWWVLQRYKKSYGNRALKIVILTLAISSLILLAAVAHLFSTIWLKNLLHIFNTIDWSNFNALSGALSQRPAIWLAALKMWCLFPIFGVGQGEFLPLSHLFNFYTIPDLIIGENTHNYFLQTLTETGLVGAIVFAVAITAPFFLVQDRRVLMPAAIALFSLFLGNVYAHSFLVRENLFLAAILLGLMYSYIPQERLALSPYKLLKEWRPKVPWKVILPLFFFGALGFGAREIYTSFYRFPFEYGRACFVNQPISADKWSSGLYEVFLPIGSRGVQIPIRVARPDLQNSPLSATLGIIDSGNKVLASQHLIWSKEGANALKINLPDGAGVVDSGVKASLRLSSCWTPRNFGESKDGRRLGVLIDTPIVY